ncbi:WSC2 protein, partial [Colletotrichum asianum]
MATMSVIIAAKCPDSSWKLWGVNGKLDNGGWCCMDGFNGTYRDNSQGIALLCTSTTATALPANISWAGAVSTSSCSVTATSTVATTSTGSSAASDIPTTTGTGTAASSTGTALAGNEDSGGISGGAVAGAVVGGVAGIGLILAAIFFVWRRKRGSKTAATGPDGSNQGGWAYGEQSASKHTYQMPSEMSAQPSRVEMDVEILDLLKD